MDVADEIRSQATVESVWDGVRAAVESFSLLLNRVLSWSVWVPIFLLGSMVGVFIGRTDLVMLILTIQTSVDAAATKTLQSHVREIEDGRARLLWETVESTSALVVEIRNQSDSIIELMRAAERRDRLAAKRDRVILDALEASGDLYEFIATKGASVDGKHAIKAPRCKSTPGRKRAPHGSPHR